MPAVKVNLKGVHALKSNGKWYYYAWRGGPRIHAEPRTPEFIRQYQEACDPHAKVDQRRFSAWIALYRASDDFKKLAYSTQAEWNRWLDRIQDHFGGLSVALFDRPTFRVDVRKWRDKWKGTPRTADYGKQVLSRVLSFIVAEGKLGSNICLTIPNLYEVDRSEMIWTPTDLQTFTTSSHTSKEIAWAARLASLTGLRKGDLIRLSWSHVSKYAIEISTRKSGCKRKAVIPITAELRKLLDEIPKLATTVLTTSRARPWTDGGFSSSWQTAIGHTALAARDLHLHDLRGTAATNFYRAGLTLREIAEILGWGEGRIEKLIDRYVKRDEILQDRIRRMEQYNSGGNR